MVDEGFRLSRAFWHTEDVGEELFDDEEVRLGRECCVKRQYRAGAFEAVASEVEFRHGMYWAWMSAFVHTASGSTRTVLEVHLDRRSIGRLAHPYIEVLSFPRLKKYYVVAIVEFRKLVELVQFGLCIKLCILAAVRQESVKVIEKMSVPVGNASRAKDQNSLLVLLYDTIACGSFGGGCLRKGLIDGGHWELLFFVSVQVCTFDMYSGHNIRKWVSFGEYRNFREAGRAE